MYQDKFLNDLVNKYNINLETENDVLKQFILDFNEKLEESEYLPIPEDINIIRCFEDKCVPGRKGTCIAERHYCYILVYTGLFQDMLKECPEHKEDIIKSYVMTILHELAHFFAEWQDSFDKDIIDEAHGQDWIKCAKFLGMEDKYISPYI